MADDGHSGEPMSPEDILDQVFDPFALEGKPAGERGLGLAICYRIVTEHGGVISAANREQGGTRISIRLPLEASPSEVRA